MIIEGFFRRTDKSYTEKHGQSSLENIVLVSSVHPSVSVQFPIKTGSGRIQGAPVNNLSIGGR